VEELDRKVRERRFGWRTALHVWGDVRKMFADACSSKRRR
jgi:hypothetical protein